MILDKLTTRIATSLGTVTPVDSVSLSVPVGGAVGLVGESGSGKSMTAFSIMRLFPTAVARVAGGRVIFDGRELAQLSDAEMRTVRGRVREVAQAARHAEMDQERAGVRAEQ